MTNKTPDTKIPFSVIACVQTGTERDDLSNWFVWLATLEHEGRTLNVEMRLAQGWVGRKVDGEWKQLRSEPYYRDRNDKEYLKWLAEKAKCVPMPPDIVLIDDSYKETCRSIRENCTWGQYASCFDSNLDSIEARDGYLEAQRYFDDFTKLLGWGKFYEWMSSPTSEELKYPGDYTSPEGRIDALLQEARKLALSHVEHIASNILRDDETLSEFIMGTNDATFLSIDGQIIHLDSIEAASELNEFLNKHDKLGVCWNVLVLAKKDGVIVKQ